MRKVPKKMYPSEISRWGSQKMFDICLVVSFTFYKFHSLFEMRILLDDFWKAGKGIAFWQKLQNGVLQTIEI